MHSVTSEFTFVAITNGGSDGAAAAAVFLFRCRHSRRRSHFGVFFFAEVLLPVLVLLFEHYVYTLPNMATETMLYKTV